MSKFKVGDKVKIKSWEQMFREYPHNSSSDYINLPVSDFSREMKYLCGEPAIIKTIGDEYVSLEFYNKKLNTNWTYSIYMLEPNFELSPESQKEWDEISEKSFKGKPVVDPDEVCGKNLFDGAKWKNDFYEKYILGIWEKEEEKEMNKVLNLWFERKQEKIIKKYAEMEQDFINNHYSVVKSYNELVEQFEKDLDDLYKFDKVNEQFVLEEISDKNTIKYDIDFDKLSREFTDKHIKEKQGELKELAKIREEVEAQLSLSNELNYQQEVLIQYNIIDKKTKKIVE